MTPTNPKITSFTRYLAVFTIVGLFSLPAFAQVSMPDYSKWTFTTSSANVIHNDKTVSLMLHHYLNTNEKEKHMYVNILHNENGKPWIAFHIIIYPDQSKRNEFHLFEYKNDKWEYVKNFSDSQDLGQDTEKFLKTTYNFTFQ